jgi:hypothetical protein
VEDKLLKKLFWIVFAISGALIIAGQFHYDGSFAVCITGAVILVLDFIIALVCIVAESHQAD